jgi:radical SAM protein with 4Fe4S-binding SPASM domain
MNPFRLKLPSIAGDDIHGARVAPLPRVLWIELTSRCPFDCVFCSRSLLRGNGEHMDFALYERLIGELRDPDTIRLNYSGESAHYPKIVEACRLAAATGARVELVTALAALPWHRLDALAHSGLTRLTVSLHTMDAEQFRAIYGFSELAAMRERIERIVALAPTAPRPLEIDFAFVAMRRNLDQLLAVAAYAQSLGIERLAVHPVIRRDPISETFPDELDGDRLRPGFLDALRATVEQTKAAHPGLRIEASTPELDAATTLDHVPRYYPAELPPGARIHGCDQDPWETVHILANGSVVACEERDRIPLGQLREQSLAEIWHGHRYRQFREDYVQARDARCRRCPYKRAHLPSPPPFRVLAGGEGSAGLLDGWFEGADAGLRWSRPRSQLQLEAQGSGRIRLSGLLPSGRENDNTLRIRANGVELARIAHGRSGMRRFDLVRRVRADGAVRLDFEVSQPYCPREHGDGTDSRQLGFALIEAAFELR